jgi:hypothetical protein
LTRQPSDGGRDFRSPPNNGHEHVSRIGLLSADIVAEVENRATRKISRKLIFGLLRRCVAFQRHYGDPWSILDETIWSLTSPLVKRISGSKKFRSSPPKRLLQQYLPNSDIGHALDPHGSRRGRLARPLLIIIVFRVQSSSPVLRSLLPTFNIAHLKSFGAALLLEAQHSSAAQEVVRSVLRDA